MKAWTGRLFRALAFGVLTAALLALIRSQTGGEAEPIADLAVRAVAYAIGYLIGEGLMARWRTGRPKVTKTR